MSFDKWIPEKQFGSRAAESLQLPLVFQRSRSGINTVDCEESLSLFANRLLSGSEAYDGTGTAGVDAHANQIEIDDWRGPGTCSEVRREGAH